MPLPSNHLTWIGKRSEVPWRGLAIAALIPHVMEALRVPEDAAFLVDLGGLAHKGSG